MHRKDTTEMLNLKQYSRIQIHIKLKSWIRIQIFKKWLIRNTAPLPCLYFSFLFSIFFWSFLFLCYVALFRSPFYVLSGWHCQCTLSPLGQNILWYSTYKDLTSRPIFCRKKHFYFLFYSCRIMRLLHRAYTYRIFGREKQMVLFLQWSIDKMHNRLNFSSS